MPAQTVNFTVYIHLLILTYKYHHLSELWFMSCIHDSLFVIGNNFMTLAFFLSSSLMSLNILFDFWHHYDYFVTSPFIPDLLTADLWKIKQEKIFNSDCFFSLLSDSSNPVSSPIIAQTKPRIESADDLEVRLVF